MELLIAFALFALLNGWIGWLIGKGKGRGTAGFWWGVLLGWIGWIIAATLSPSIEAEIRRAKLMKIAMDEAGESS